MWNEPRGQERISTSTASTDVSTNRIEDLGEASSSKLPLDEPSLLQVLEANATEEFDIEVSPAYLY